MRSSTLFGLYAAIIISLIGGLAGLTLYSLEKARWWDARTQLAQDSFSLHQRLESNLYRLFKQQGDALLLGRDSGGESVADLREKISSNLSDIRAVIAREIQMVGEEEVEELEFLDQIEEDIRTATIAIDGLTAAGDPLEVLLQSEHLGALLDGDIDQKLDIKIAAALEEELEEVEEVKAEAAAFRRRNQVLVYGILLLALAVLGGGLWSFNSQIRRPIIRLQNSVNRLRELEYGASVHLGGSQEFRTLGTVLTEMSETLAAREASHDEQSAQLEKMVTTRTSELKGLVDKLEMGEENRKRLMADISHELRTPLAIILGEADVTLRTTPDLDPTVSDSLARIRDSAKHTNQIVDDMLTVARVEAGHLRLDRKEVDLRKIIHDALAIFPADAKSTLPDSAVPAMVDEVRLRQAVLALLQNAKRYGGPTVSVTLAQTPQAVTITVDDDGPGMSAAEKSQAFVRFFRGSNMTGQGAEGTGLGLPVVKSVADAHGGHVSVDDSPYGGLRVVIHLPPKPTIRAVGPDDHRKFA